MKMLARSVLIMEFFVMCFALLLARISSTAMEIFLGGVIALAALLTSGLLKKRSGWILGWTVQIAMVSYGLVIFMMYFVGALFLALWIAAIVVGRKGEAIRATLTKEREAKKDQ